MTTFTLRLPMGETATVNIDVRLQDNPEFQTRIEDRIAEVLREHWGEVDGLEIVRQTPAAKGKVTA